MCLKLLLILLLYLSITMRLNMFDCALNCIYCTESLLLRESNFFSGMFPLSTIDNIDVTSTIVGRNVVVTNQQLVMTSFTLLCQCLPRGGRSPAWNTLSSNSSDERICPNGFLSAHISHSSTPKEYTSAGRLYPSPLPTSGAIYLGVPHRCIITSFSGKPTAKPKSNNFTVPYEST